MAESKTHYYYALGRRKSATARVRLMNGKGACTVNGKALEEYFANSKQLITEVQKPFSALELPIKDFDVSVVVSGGGHAGQVDAIRLGIAKALVERSEEYKATLRRAGLLGRDSRERERKKFGLRSARKQRQFTKR
ncbi:30S ribosomal protein S9 [Candidatus Saccharibacteria bacterium]|nr:MAG: 30S ribosomal protein S9 [Candidatus Saccharibacteria bacterium]PID99339.1 MAG: 30S ribosomal protein S9 [Candidatus Saccharibacteria bacterium]